MILIFDADKSTSVIEDKIDSKVFQIRKIRTDFEGEEIPDGHPQDAAPVTVHGMDFHMRHYLRLLFTKQVITYKDPTFGYEDQQTIVALNEKAKEIGLHTIVVDTISGMGESMRLALISDSRFSNMSKDLWGKYGIRISKVMAMIKDLPINIIVTSHIEYGEDDIGTAIHFPAVKGSQKTDMLRWFDVIIYTHVEPDGAVLWQVMKDETRPFIRSRKPIPEWEGKKFVEPDFGPIYATYNGAQKTLLIGDSGTGKTSSLITIPKTLDNGSKAKGKAKNSKSNGERSAESAQTP